MALQPCDQMNTLPQLSSMVDVSFPSIISPKETRLSCNDSRLNAMEHEFKEMKMVDCYPLAGRPRLEKFKFGKADLGCFVDKLEKRSCGKMRIGSLQSGDRQHARWLHHVRRLRYHQKSFQEKLQEIRLHKSKSSSKPFGKFLNSKLVLKCDVTTKRSTSEADQLSLKSRKRHVTFNSYNLPKNPVVTGVSMHTAVSGNSTLSNQSSEKKAIGSLSTHRSHSLHRCEPMKTKILHKRKLERLFWSQNDIKKTMAKSQRRANAFRSENPATVKQLSRVFMDTCCQSKNRQDDWHSDDEDQEEMLRNFLRDWAASNVRGLEEHVTGRDLFKETRKMAVQSVLAYQQTLRDTMCATTIDRMSDLLRARSESTSHRARMFAMYLALGDAIVANSNSDECSLHEDRSTYME